MMLSFGEAVALFYKNYVKFKGRSSRAEYWWSALFQIMVYTGLVVAIILVGGIDGNAPTSASGIAFSLILVAGAIFWLINFLPGISIQVRRFHDLDQTGWLVLVFVIANAFIGLTAIAQLIWFAVPGKEGRNKYGPNPYQSEADVFGEVDVFG